MSGKSDQTSPFIHRLPGGCPDGVHLAVSASFIVIG